MTYRGLERARFRAGVFPLCCGHSHSPASHPYPHAPRVSPSDHHCCLAVHLATMQGPGHNAIRVMATLTRSSSVTSRILPAARRPTPWAHTSRAFSDFSGVDSFAHGNSVRDIHSTAVQQNAPAPHQQDDEPKRVSSSFNSSSTAAGTPAPSLVTRG